MDAADPLGGTQRHALDLAEAILNAHDADGATAAIVALPTHSTPMDFAQAAFWLPRHAHWPVYRALPTGSAPEAVAQFLTALAVGEPALVIEPWRPKAPRIETPRLTLTLPDAGQIRAHNQALRRSKVFEWLIWQGPDSLDDLQDWWALAGQLAAQGPQAPLSLAIIESATGAFIGSATARPRGKSPGNMELGYLILEPWQGRGYATEAVGALVDALFSTRALRRIEADVFLNNTPSERLLTRLGFTREGLQRARLSKNGCPLDTTAWALTRDTWRPQEGVRLVYIPR